ncbi:MAG: DUF2029 domain-containing protein [Aureispira sp.]|nr:DUF2029 domain-containing protein [Aureispira sp.]
MPFLKQKYFSGVELFLFLILLVYSILKANAHGDDINAYLHVSELLFQQKNIYADTGLNPYQYSPLFAYLIHPLTLLPIEIARILWAILNFLFLLRLWMLVKNILLINFPLPKHFISLFLFVLLLLSFDSFNNNLILGQITLLVLWLSIEGLYQVILKKKNSLGAFWIALGINIKIIPVLALFYLLFKQRFLAVGIVAAFFIGTLIGPSLVLGHQYNIDLLSKWKENTPLLQKGSTFENNNTHHSLSAIFPGYFHDFASPEDNNFEGFQRKIVYLSDTSLTILLQVSRLLLLLSFLAIIFYQRKKRKQQALYIWWEIAYLLLFSFLVFPNQPRYTLFYFFPACAYLLFFIFLLLYSKDKASFRLKTVAVLASFIMLLLASMGRDLIGRYLINLLDFYHIPGLLFIVTLGLLFWIKPNKLLALESAINKHKN